jgi:hypothetical protein
MQNAILWYNLSSGSKAYNRQEKVTVTEKPSLGPIAERSLKRLEGNKPAITPEIRPIAVSVLSKQNFGAASPPEVTKTYCCC